MKRFVSRRLTAGFLVACSAQLASAPSVALGAPGVSAPLSALPAGSTRGPVVVTQDGATLVVSTCDAQCKEGEPNQKITLPSDAVSLPRKITKLSLEGQVHALLFKWGPKERYYSVVVLGAPLGEGKTLSAPEIVLKGWGGSASKSGSEVVVEKNAAAQTLSLISPVAEVACGRKVPAKIQRLDVTRGRFVGVTQSVVTSAERAKLKELSAAPVVSVLGQLLQLQIVGDGSARAPLDADRRVPWTGGHEYAEFKAPGTLSLKELVLEVSAPLKDPAELYLLGPGSAFRLKLEPSDSRFYRLTVPEGLGSGCLAVAQPRTPVPLAEVMALAQTDKESSTEALVLELSQEDPGYAPFALPLRGQEAAAQLAKSYPKMSSPGRVRARSVATALGVLGAPVFVASLEFDTEGERTAALGALLAHKEASVAALSARMKEAPPAGAAKLATALSALSPAVAAKEIPPLLSGQNVALRAYLRELIARLASDPVAADLLRDEAPKLSRSARIELLRALGPHLKEWALLGEVSGLNENATFDEAYRLLPITYLYAADSVRLAEEFRGFLSARLPAAAKETERAALSSYALELMLEENARGSSLRKKVSKELPELAQSSNARVRKAAFSALRLSPQGISEDEMLNALVKDPWPRVRAAAAELAGTRLEKTPSESTLRTLSRRVRKDPHATARRAMARALGSVRDERALTALRKSHKQDDSYEVRSEAALSLGRLCDSASIETLTDDARVLAKNPTGDGQILLGLSAVSALAEIDPPDLDKRLAPLLTSDSPGLLRSQVQRRLETAEASQDGRCSEKGLPTQP